MIPLFAGWLEFGEVEVHGKPVDLLANTPAARQKPSSLVRFLPVSQYLLGACLWCLGARMWRANLPRGVKQHTESAFLNTAHSVSTVAQAAKQIGSGSCKVTACNATQRLPCHANASCGMVNGSAVCTCEPGLTGTGE